MLKLIPWQSLPQVEEPRVPLTAFRRDMDRLFDRFLGEFWGDSEGSVADSVRMEVFETHDEIHVRAEVPGIDPKDLNIQLVGDVLVLSGEKKEEEQRGARTYSERSYGAFRRSLRLSTPVDADHVKAEHRNGVVMIQLTKSEAVRPKRIQIKSN